MTVTERVAYVKGLAEGMELDAGSKEGKILKAMIDVLEDIAYEISDLGDEIGELEEQVDMIDDDLDTLEGIVYEDDEDEEDDEDLYEVVCPNCGDTIYLDEEMLEDGEMDCPNCGEHLEFDFDEDEEDDEEPEDEE